VLQPHRGAVGQTKFPPLLSHWRPMSTLTQFDTTPTNWVDAWAPAHIHTCVRAKEILREAAQLSQTCMSSAGMLVRRERMARSRIWRTRSGETSMRSLISPMVMG